jgi:rare lipoprotein A
MISNTEQYKLLKHIGRGAIILWLIAIPVVASASISTDTSTKKKGLVLTGKASFYANKFNGKKTASGEIFSQQKMTAACNKLPLGTWVKVINLKNNNEVIVKVNDRLHAKNRRLIDLSLNAAKKLDFFRSGTVNVKVIKINAPQKEE